MFIIWEKCLPQVNLCYLPAAKMVAINNIEIFGSVCRETNPSAINIKRGKDKQALFLYLVMDFSSLICDFFKILFPVPYHSFHVTGNVFQGIINTVKHS
jgi:hypothetical protein